MEVSKEECFSESAVAIVSTSEVNDQRLVIERIVVIDFVFVLIL